MTAAATRKRNPSLAAVAIAALTAAGYTGRQPPFDAFWGQRYATVLDPDGTPVDLFSPLEEEGD